MRETGTFDVLKKGDNLRYGYAYYVGRCKQEGITPIDFRTWARVDAEYDIEWEAARRYYEEALNNSGELNA